MELSNARPYAFKFNPTTTALVIIDMQRDFLLPNGFGAIQCGSEEIFSQVSSIIPAVQRVLAHSRSLGFHIIHTREGHKPDLSDLPAAKRLRQISAPSGHHTMGIGEQGPMGRLLVRGEYGHAVIDELKPLPGEVVIDKPGKGSYWDTNLHRSLLARGITHLLFAGVTTECCVTTTVRESSDRGFECCILSDCTGGFDKRFVTTSLDMICSYDGLFGYVTDSADLIAVSARHHDLTPPTTPPAYDGELKSMAEMQDEFRSGRLDPKTVVQGVYDRIESYGKVDAAVWIHIQNRDHVLGQAKELSKKYQGKPLPPLYGIPFAVKDNIDVKGLRTTGACEAYAYTAATTSPVVELLLEAGALFIGKLNMDQLATGLSGCRSPYGTPHSIYSSSHISGGSSSGSAVAVAAGLVSFSLGTDTAGSGRVPAALNGIIGYKPTKGTLSARGVIPACASLDTISIFAKSIEDARQVWYIADAYDAQDPHAKLPNTLPTWECDFRGPAKGGFTFGAPPASALESCTKAYKVEFDKTIKALQSLGGTPKEIDWTPFQAGSGLLYNASLVNERIACIGPSFLLTHMTSLHPTTQALFNKTLTANTPAWQVFQDLNLQAKYTRAAQEIFEKIDVLISPSTPFHPTIKEMQDDPVGLNSKLGVFTHFGNVLDMCAVSVNAGWVEGGLPFGVQVVGGMGRDGYVLDIARLLESAVGKAKDM